MLVNSMNTKHYLSKKIAYFIFGEKYYHKVKSFKIIFDVLIGKDYDGIYRYISKIIPSNSVVIDVGANMGQCMARLSRIIKNGQVFSIEPIPENISALKLMISILKIKNAFIIDKAISCGIGKATISIPRLNGIPITTQSTLANERNQSIAYDKLDVRTTTIDSIVKSHKIDKVDFIKIDTEGFDNVVLNSGYNTIYKYRPLLKTEINPLNDENRWLFDIGYQAFKIVNNNIFTISNMEEVFKFKGDTYLAIKEQLDEIHRVFNP